MNTCRKDADIRFDSQVGGPGDLRVLRFREKSLQGLARTSIALTLAVCTVLGAATAHAKDEIQPAQAFMVRAYDGTYLPAAIRRPAGPGPFPALLLLPGGLGGHGPAMLRGLLRRRVAEHFLARGYVVMAGTYRRYHFGHDEIQDVLADYHSLAHEAGVDPDRIGIVGGSHGGYLATMLATRVRPAAVVSFAGLADIEGRYRGLADQLRKGITNLDDWHRQLLSQSEARAADAASRDAGTATETDSAEPAPADRELALYLAWRFRGYPEGYRTLSALDQSARIQAPLLYVVGEEDPLVAEGRELVRRMRSHGSMAALSVHPGVGHGFQWGHGAEPGPAFEAALAATTVFLDRYVRPRQPSPAKPPTHSLPPKPRP